MASFLITQIALVAIATSARVVDRYTVQFSSPTTSSIPHSIPAGGPQPPGGPYAGNGDVTVMYTANATVKTRYDTIIGWQQWFHLSKNDMWGSDSQDYYPHLSAGRVGIMAKPPGTGANTNGTVTMFPGNASLVSVLKDSVEGKSMVSTSTRVLENNAIVTTFQCTTASSDKMVGGGGCPLTLTLSDTNGNHYKVQQQVGSASDGTSVWWRKENIHNPLNSAYLGSCDPNVPIQSTERLFNVDAATGRLQMANGSCLYVDNATATLASGSCSSPSGEWTWKGNTTKGDIVQTSSSQCLSTSLKLGACGTMPWSQMSGVNQNASLVYLSSSPTKCLIVVPDNNNNTLGVAMGVADANGNLVKGSVKQVSPKDPSAGISLSMSLQSGVEYSLIIGLQTLRDIGCAGIRPQWETCTTSPEVAATALVESMASTSKRSAAEQDSAAFWKGFWAASEVDLTSKAINASSSGLDVVERWYYLSQYLLGCTTRDGKVTSALDGFVCLEPVAWGDQFTLDYNLEATFWGAGSSNRLDFIHPVMASTTNPGARATAQLRAQTPGTWGPNPKWPGNVGSTVSGAACSPACPNLTKTGFKGAEWPSAGMPLGDNRLADSDLQTRFIGGLLSTNLIQYWEYSQNVTTLREAIYPFVKDNAEFYLSYTTKGPDGKLVFPYSCAQEGCACRDAGFIKYDNVQPIPNYTTTCKEPQSPFESRCPGASGWEKNHPCYECYPYIATGSHDGYHNAHPDVAFASYSFRNAIRFAKILGVDMDRVPLWEDALSKMPDYPSADLTFVDNALGSEFNGGAGFFVEAAYGYQPGVLPDGKTTPVTWPWCNMEYPIANFAAMWPTDEIGATQTTDKALLARAKQTVYGLNKYQSKPWANTNGFCLSWPPAVRVSGKEDSEHLIQAFAKAIHSATGNNGCVHNHGGMLENIGATVAINDLLLQSHGGRMRFFPAWNSSGLGAASFTTLRAYGAFLVSASIDVQGVVSSVTLLSEVGSNAVFESPWSGTPKVTDDKGSVVPCKPTTGMPNVFNFTTKANGKYTIANGN